MTFDEGAGPGPGLHRQAAASNLMAMRYTYATAWKVIGGVHLEPNTELTLHDSERCRFTLTTAPDRLLASVDRSRAVMRLVGIGRLNLNEPEESQARLHEEASRIRKERGEATRDRTFLIAEGFGERVLGGSAPVDPGAAGFVIDAIDHAEIREAHREEQHAIRMAFAFETAPPRLEKIADGIYLTDEEGRTIGSVNFHAGSATLRKGMVADDGTAGRIAERYHAIKGDADLASVRRLYAQMSEHETDPLKAFLFGWLALEILTAKAFKKYERDFMSPLLSSSLPQMPTRVLDRIRSVMKDKYRLADKFLCVTAVLFPGADEQHVEVGFDRFMDLKKTRDAILHGEDFAPETLPVGDLAHLLRDYVFAYLRAVAPPSDR